MVTRSATTARHFILAAAIAWPAAAGAQEIRPAPIAVDTVATIDTAVDNNGNSVTGVFFDAQTPEALMAATEQLAATRFDPETIRAHARTFDASVFRRTIAAYVDECWHAHTSESVRQYVSASD